MNFNIKNKLNKYITIKNTSYLTFALNLTSIVLGIIYLVIPIYNIVWDILGVILIITLFTNLLLMFLNGCKLNMNMKLGRNLNLLSYIFIFINGLALILMALGNILISVTYSNDLFYNLGWYLMVYFGYFGLLSFGAFLAVFNIKNLKNDDLWDSSKNDSYVPSERVRLIKWIKIILGGLSVVMIGFAVYFAGFILFGSVSSLIGDDIGGSIGGFASQFSIFISFAIIGSVIILLKLITNKKHPRIFYSIGILGLILSGIFLLPLLYTPASIIDSEISFVSSFGRNSWTITNQHFMVTPYSIPGTFLGIAPKSCVVIPNQLYYVNASEGISLYFDAYLPPNGGVGLPGKNSTIIKIHGGGWQHGDKGVANMMQVNKYLASQGYVVFDIQYGLIRDPEPPLIPTPVNVIGDFTVDDQIQQIGNFCNYIGLNNATYGANLDCVFTMGNSAGGHLALATGLGIWSGNYTSIFGTNITIKGMIPIYPGRGSHIYSLGLSCSPEFAYPENMINNTSPPALIYQGTQDGLVNPCLTQNLKNIYTNAGSTKCAIVWAHGAGHGSDFYFSGYHNQIFMYYLERFLYLCVNNLI